MHIVVIEQSKKLNAVLNLSVFTSHLNLMAIASYYVFIYLQLLLLIHCTLYFKYYNFENGESI